MTHQLVTLKLNKTNVTRALQGYKRDASSWTTKTEAVELFLSILQGEYRKSSETLSYYTEGLRFSVDGQGRTIQVYAGDSLHKTFRFFQ